MRCDETLSFHRAELRELCDLWRAKAASGVPTRSALDMRALRPFASHLTILERVGALAARRYRFRLFGSTLALLFGEHTGRFLDEMVSTALLPNWLAYYDAVLAHRAPFRFINYYRIPSEDYLKGEFSRPPWRMTQAKPALSWPRPMSALKTACRRLSANLRGLSQAQRARHRASPPYGRNWHGQRPDRRMLAALECRDLFGREADLDRCTEEVFPSAVVRSPYSAGRP